MAVGTVTWHCPKCNKRIDIDSREYVIIHEDERNGCESYVCSECYDKADKRLKQLLKEAEQNE